MKDGPALKVTICLGSSCFARGNRAVLQALQQYLRAEKLEQQIALVGSRCESRCRQGPNLRVGDQLHHDVDRGAAIDLLRESMAARRGSTAKR